MDSDLEKLRAHAGADAADERRITIGEREFPPQGGLLCLDFVNTVDTWHPRKPEGTPAFADDYLGGYADLLAWAHQIDIVGARSKRALTAAAERNADEAAVVFRRAVALRTAIHHLAVAAAEGRAAPAPQVATLNAEVGPLLAASRLEPDGAAYRLARPGEWDEGVPNPPLDTVLWPVVRSAIALFTSPEALARVRACPGEGCGWLFYDATGRRRWCSMASCGTRHKVRRFRARQRRGAPASG